MLDKIQLANKLREDVGEDILKITLSNPLKKSDELPHKTVIERLKNKDKEFFQFAYYIEKKVVHENSEENGIIILEKAIQKMENGFKQMFISAKNCEITVLMNKKKQFKIADIKKTENSSKAPKAHNKVKNYVLKEGEFVPWMYKLDMMNKDGVILSHMQRKFRQINKFLEMVEDIEKYIPENAVIVDMGCGKSYLTFAMYYYFNEIKKKNVKIKGFDLKKDVVENCNKLAEEFGFDKLKFYADDIANLDTSEEKINMIITLHACDTATDYAMFHAVKWGCQVIMSVPCCQHELFSQIENDNLKMLLNYGILKERFSALFTDSLRANMLELCGYKTSVMEFIDMEHTPKNIMIRAIKKNNYKLNKDKVKEYKKLIKDFNVEPTIYKLLKYKIEE